MNHYYLITDNEDASKATLYIESGPVAAVPPFQMEQVLEIYGTDKSFIVHDIWWSVVDNEYSDNELHCTVLVK